MPLLFIRLMVIMFVLLKTVSEYKQILHFLQPATPGWMSTAMPVSSWEKRGLDKVWSTIGSSDKSLRQIITGQLDAKIRREIGSNR